MLAAGQLHQAPHRGLRVLPGQQAGPVAGELGLAEPLLERGDQRHDGQVAERDPADPGGQVGEDQQHRPVDRVTGHRVSDLVADHGPQLLLVEQLDQAAGDHDDRGVHADAHGVDQRPCMASSSGTFSRSRM